MVTVALYTSALIETYLNYAPTTFDALSHSIQLR